MQINPNGVDSTEGFDLETLEGSKFPSLELSFSCDASIEHFGGVWIAHFFILVREFWDAWCLAP